MNGLRVEIALIKDIGVAYLIFKAGYLRLKLSLLVHRLIILGVFGEIAEGTRDLDSLCNLISADCFELFKFLDLDIIALFCQYNMLFHLYSSFFLIFGNNLLLGTDTHNIVIIFISTRIVNSHRLQQIPCKFLRAPVSTGPGVKCRLRTAQVSECRYSAKLKQRGREIECIYTGGFE